MTQATAWFVRRRGRVEGPWDLRKLQSEASLRRLARYDELSIDRTNWFQAGDHPELFPPTPSAIPRYPLAASTASASSGASSGDERKPQEQSFAYAPLPEEPAQAPLSEPIWYYDRGGEADGPHPIETILAMIEERRLTLNDPVWRDGFEDWKTIGQSDEILARLPVPPSDAPAQTFSATGDRTKRTRRRIRRAQGSYALGAWSLILAGVLLVPSLAPGCGMLGLFPFVMSCIAVYESGSGRREGVGFAIGGLALSSLEMLLSLIWFAYLYGAGSSAWSRFDL